MCFQQFPVSQKTGCIEEFGHVVRTIFWCLSFFRDNNKGPLFSFGCVVELQRWCASSSRKWQGFFFSSFSVSTKAVSDLVGQNRGSTTYVCSRQHAYFFPILWNAHPTICLFRSLSPPPTYTHFQKTYPNTNMYFFFLTATRSLLLRLARGQTQTLERRWAQSQRTFSGIFSNRIEVHFHGKVLWVSTIGRESIQMQPFQSIMLQGSASGFAQTRRKAPLCRTRDAFPRTRASESSAMGSLRWYRSAVTFWTRMVALISLSFLVLLFSIIR